MAIDERRLRAELPEFLELLGNVSGWVGGLDLAKAREVPADALGDLRDSLLRALGFLHELFALRGEPPPSPAPGIAFSSLGPGLKRTLPQRLAAELEDELNAVAGPRLEDLTQFTALGLFSRVSDLLRFVGFLEAERAAAEPPPAPPPAADPGGPGPDLSAYDIRIDETGERVDADGGSVWFASSAGPLASSAGLAASFAVPFPGGAALAVAEGVESSLGARLAAVVAVRAFCRAAAADPSGPQAALAAARTHLDLLLSALLPSGDASPALARVRGSVSPANARRILAHTRQPEAALHRVAPALSTSLVGAVALRASGGTRVAVVRLGPGSAEVRVSGRVTPLLDPLAAVPPSLLGPGPRGEEDLRRAEVAEPAVLAAGDALLLGTPAVAKGSAGAWAGLATLWAPFPDGFASGDMARDLLRRAERWGAAEPPSFGGPLSFALLLAR